MLHRCVQPGRIEDLYSQDSLASTVTGAEAQKGF